jgi:hypothetical protein
MVDERSRMEDRGIENDDRVFRFRDNYVTHVRNAKS